MGVVVTTWLVMYHHLRSRTVDIPIAPVSARNKRTRGLAADDELTRETKRECLDEVGGVNRTVFVLNIDYIDVLITSSLHDS